MSAVVSFWQAKYCFLANGQQMFFFVLTAIQMVYSDKSTIVLLSKKTKTIHSIVSLLRTWLNYLKKVDNTLIPFSSICSIFCSFLFVFSTSAQYPYATRLRTALLQPLLAMPVTHLQWQAKVTFMCIVKGNTRDQQLTASCL